MSFTTYCPQCRSKLIPIIYGRVDNKYLQLEADGIVIIGGLFKKPFNSFCLLCEESYDMYTDMPN